MSRDVFPFTQQWKSIDGPNTAKWSYALHFLAFKFHVLFSPAVTVAREPREEVGIKFARLKIGIGHDFLVNGDGG